MDNYQGDLADMIRATVDGATAPTNWPFPTNTIQYSSDPVDDFGDPFSYIMGDPLMQINNIDSSQSGFLYNSTAVRTAGELAGVNSVSHKVVNVDDDHMIKRPPNIISRMLQISPNEKFGVAPPCDSTAAPLGLKCNRPPAESRGIQISSPRNTGIKRRKSQAKKVVCIPAPAPANSRATGEVVPSDLWAWRKYGQKPIKGSPYPRGYYRCSSSKGCSARKQVERSRTDPNMLVITYTSEHNHPWPTQRNALAGSTRSQPSKNTKNKSQNSDPQKPTNSKQDPKDIRPKNPQTSSPGDDDPTPVKEETDQDFDNIMEDSEFDDGLPQTLYKPTMVDSDSFFADLDEINEADPLDLLFGQGFSRNDDSGRGNGDLDPFSFYDWATGVVDGGAGGGSAATPHRG